MATPPAGAEHIRAHGTVGVAKAFGGHQERELSLGGGIIGGVELPLIPQVGVQAEVGALMLTEGDAPLDPKIQPEGGAHTIHGALGVQARPFIKKDPTDINGFSGIWVGANFGATTTGGRFRPMFDVFGGYDFLLEQGRFGLGPTVGLVHVFQPDDELRPDDANIVVLGVHGMFDNVKLIPPDVDHDGIIDRLDKCPTDPEDKDGFQDEDGCPELDNDGDGVVDASDKCPMDPEDRDQFEDEDGCPETDNDKDGLLDPVDKCPNEPEDRDQFEDEDGCPETDNDKDGFLDKDDLCPNEPETKNGYADEDGCPDEEQIRVVGEKIILDERIHFEENNAIIRKESYGLLERLTHLIRTNPTFIHIEVQGHTDQRGTIEYNTKLSEDRAKSVLEFLVKRGIEKSRLSAVGFGATKPLDEKRNERALFLNRRVEFQITREHHVRGGATPAPGAAPEGGQNQTLPDSPVEKKETPPDSALEKKE
jgi:outer membrane protein OmpA-like peptidoglycan-associated protein